MSDNLTFIYLYIIYLYTYVFIYSYFIAELEEADFSELL